MQSIPTELNADLQIVLSFAEATGYTTQSAVQSSLGWDEERVRLALVR